MPGNHINVIYTPGPSRSRKHALGPLGRRRPGARQVLRHQGPCGRVPGNLKAAVHDGTPLDPATG
jgi:hypothetical protein